MSVSGAMAAIASVLASVNSSEDEGEELAWYVWVVLGVAIGLGIVALLWWGSR